MDVSTQLVSKRVGWEKPSEIDNKIREYGGVLPMRLDAPNLHPDLVKIMDWACRFRTSYGQNVLRHSIEVAKLAGIMASELGENATLARRAGFLHDIGKAIDREVKIATLRWVPS